MAYYKWERIIDTGIRVFGSDGIMAIGQTGLYRPIENLKLDTNVVFSSAVPYFDGYLLLAPGIIVYSDVNGNSSETKMDLRLTDGTICNGLIVLGTEDGRILLGKTKLQFQEYSRSLKTINRINTCKDKVVICGENQISILWEEDSTIKYSIISYNCNFINAYLSNNKIYALSSDGYLNIFFVDENMNWNTSDTYRVNVVKALKDVEVYNLYVESSKADDIYFLCSSGEIGLISDFNYNKDTIKDIGDKLILYAAKLTNNSFFKDMIQYDDKYIIVGYGEENKSCVQTTMLKTEIITHNILNDISGPERCIYNYSTSYEDKYTRSGGNISDLRSITTITVPVQHDSQGNYISKFISVQGFYTDIIEVPDALYHTDQGEKIYVRSSDTTDVVVCVDTTRRV
jgi:hypothetical protein